jgi:hypothetical protein
MSKEKITFFKEGERHKEPGNKLKWILILLPFIVFIIAFTFQIAIVYNVSKKVLKECNISENDLIKIGEECRNGSAYCAGNECVIEKIASNTEINVANFIYNFALKMFLINIFIFLFLTIFGDKYLSKTSKWIRSFLFAFMFLLFLSFAGAFPAGVFSIYLIFPYVAIGSLIAMATIRCSFASGMLFSIFSLFIIFISSLFF